MRELVVSVIAVTPTGEVLLCRRGPGSRFEQGKWNLPGGHLEMDESLEDCAVRECREETGVVIEKGSLQFIGINSDPNDNPRQKVSVAYAANVSCAQPTKVDGNEITEARWVNDIDSLEWAFPTQKALVKKFLSTAEPFCQTYNGF